MNELIGAIRKADISVLWALVNDMAVLMKQRGYEPKTENTAFMIWYHLYKQIEAEIDRRLVIESMEE